MRRYVVLAGNTEIVVSDLDHEGDPHRVVDSDISISLLRNLGNGSFGPRVVFPAGILYSRTMASGTWMATGT